MSTALNEPPSGPVRTFLDFPFAGDLDALEADIAILGVPFGMPYSAAATSPPLVSPVILDSRTDL